MELRRYHRLEIQNLARFIAAFSSEISSGQVVSKKWVCPRGPRGMPEYPGHLEMDIFKLCPQGAKSTDPIMETKPSLYPGLEARFRARGGFKNSCYIF